MTFVFDMWLIILLFVLAIVLILVELLLIPGFGIVGILSLGCVGVAIFLSYSNFSTAVGHIVTAISVVLFISVLVFALKSGTWSRVSLHETIASTVNDNPFEGVVVGDCAVAVSRLAPIGKVVLNQRQFEAKSMSSYIDEGQEVEVVGFEGSSLLVKRKS